MKKGFAVKEMLLLVLILAAFAAFAFPRYFWESEKKRAADMDALLADVQLAQEAFARMNGRFTAEWGASAPLLSVPRALGVGLLWGFLPCGLVYSALATAFAFGSGIHGGALMAAFALGTLPNLMLAGWVGAGTLQQFRQSSLRWLAGLLVAGWGVYGLARLLII